MGSDNFPYASKEWLKCLWGSPVMVKSEDMP